MNYLFKHLERITLYFLLALFFLALGILWVKVQELSEKPSYRYPTLQEMPEEYQHRFNQARRYYGELNTLIIKNNKFMNERGQVCTFKVRNNG